MSTLIAEAEKHIINLLSNSLSKDYLYHNLSHTQRVVKSVEELAKGENISEEETENLLLAAWFHDAGYTEKADGHEAVSSKLVNDFLKSQNTDNERIKKISNLILVTKMGHNPLTLEEKIIKDADNSHFGKKNYSEISELLRKEWEVSNFKSFNDIEWTQENIAFFTQHHRFYTNHALKNWQQAKDKNLSQLLKTQNKLQQESNKLLQKREELDFKKSKVELPERGIETMFRVTLKNHITLSDIADTKANILLSVNAIIVSLVLSNLVSKLDNASNAYLIWPTVIFVLFTVASMILSVLATRPNVTSGKFTKEDVDAKKVNLLFFGNFHKMKLDDFEWAMGEMMQDRDYLYSSMKKDLYFLGLVLNKKYSILRLTYTVFIIGILISVISFAIAFKIQGAP